MGLIRALVQHVSALVSAKLGRCPKCMGLSLGGAAIGWAVLAGVVHFWPQFAFVNLLALWPVSFTALWVLHIGTYSGRVVAAEKTAQQEDLQFGPVMTRRQIAGVLASSAALAIVVSARSAFAAGFGGAHCCTLPGVSGSCGSCNAGFTCQAVGSSMCYGSIACGANRTLGTHGGTCVKA